MNINTICIQISTFFFASFLPAINGDAQPKNIMSDENGEKAYVELVSVTFSCEQTAVTGTKTHTRHVSYLPPRKKKKGMPEGLVSKAA